MTPSDVEDVVEEAEEGGGHEGKEGGEVERELKRDVSFRWPSNGREALRTS